MRRLNEMRYAWYVKIHKPDRIKQHSHTSTRTSTEPKIFLYFHIRDCWQFYRRVFVGCTKCKTFIAAVGVVIRWEASFVSTDFNGIHWNAQTFITELLHRSFVCTNTHTQRKFLIIVFFFFSVTLTAFESEYSCSSSSSLSSPLLLLFLHNVCEVRPTN